jgi:protein arginine N-methyltransferase 1
MYTLTDYGHMMADRVRMDPYAYALKKAVYPDSVVLDIGTSIGIHALLACKFGARKVYAVEPNEVIDLAQRLALENGYADRITFIHDLSTNITLPEPADVIVSDLRGTLPLFDQHIPSIIDARQRHLAPQGILIPQKDRLWVAVVENPAIYHSLLRPWDNPYGLDMALARQMVLKEWQQDDTDLIHPSDLLTQPTNWALLDYNTIDHPDVSSGEIVQKTMRDGTAHGLLLWFDAELSEGIGFSNAPQNKRVADVYGRGFFPFLKPLPIASGDTIQLTIQANLTMEGYRWRWQTTVYSQDRKDLIKAEFDQATEY